MITEKLEKIGMGGSEAKVYLALLDLGEALAGDISKKAQINRTTVYDSLERLIERGLVTFVISSNRKLFRPVSPDNLLKNLKEKEKLVEEVLPSLNQIYKRSKEEEETNIFKGRKGIKSVLNDVLKCKEFVAFGSSGKFLEVMGHDFILFQNQKKKLKIKSRIIEAESTRKSELRNVAYAQFKYIPNEFASPITTIVYDNKVAIMVWSEIPTATVINSKQVVDSYKKYFELLWKQAKP